MPQTPRCRYSRHGFLFKAGYAPSIYLQPYPQPEWSCYYPLSNLDTAAMEFSCVHTTAQPTCMRWIVDSLLILALQSMSAW